MCARACRVRHAIVADISHAEIGREPATTSRLFFDPLPLLLPSLEHLDRITNPPAAFCYHLPMCGPTSSPFNAFSVT